MINSNSAKKEKEIIHFTIAVSIVFLLVLYITNEQNIFFMVNSRSSERSTSYSIALRNQFGDIQEQAAGSFYEYCITEKLGKYSSQKEYADICLAPLEEIELESIAVYFENILIREYTGKQILDAFNIENGQLAYESDHIVILKKIDETLPILLHKNISKEMQAVRKIFLKTVLRTIGFGILIYYAVLAVMRRYEMRKRKGQTINSDVFVLFLLMIITSVVFAPYLLGEKYFVFTMQDIANDSINQAYPILLQQAHELEQGSFAKWSFYYGLGGENSYSIFNLVYSLFGVRLVKYMLGVGAAAYCLIAGMIFFQYIKLLDLPNYIKYIGTISYAFCGCMMVRCAWQGYFREVLFVAFLLYALEKWIKENDWKYVPCAYGGIFAFCGVYTSVIWAVIGIGYCFMRLVLQEHFKMKCLWNKFFSLLLFLGIATLIAGYAMIPSITQILNSTRVQTMVSDIGIEKEMTQFFRPYTYKEIAKSLSRLFSNTFLGINNFNGIDHWMSDVALYSGLFTVLLIPQSFFHKRRAVWNGILYTLCAYYICFPTLRSLVNVFSDKYNSRLSSFWINVILIYIGCYTLKNVLDEKRCNKTILIATACVECLAMLIGTLFLKTSDSRRECAKAVFFLFILTFIILCYVNKIIGKRAVEEMLIIVCLCEIIAISYPTVNDRAVLTSKNYEKNSYEDGTDILVKEALKNSGTDFFRINKSYQSAGLNDALYQNYYGTSSYLGGTTHSNYLLNFNDAIGVRNMYNSTSYLLGYDGINSVNTMLSVKYNLSKDSLLNYGYQMVSQNDNIYMSENRNYLPLGYTYDAVMAKSDYDLLNVYDRRDALLHCAVVEDDSSLLRSNDITKISEYGIYNVIKDNHESIFDLNMDESTINMTNERYLGVSASKKIVFDVKEVKKEYIIVLADLELASRSTVYVIYHYLDADGTERNITRNLYLQIGENNVRLDIPAQNLKSISLYFEKSTTITVKNFLTCFADTDFYYLYDTDCENRNRNTLSLQEFDGDYIKGTISVESSQLFFIPIPYDKSWVLYLDGEKTELENCNIAFIGCFLESGEHMIELCYEASNPYFIVSILAVAGYISILIMVHKTRKDNHICPKRNQRQFKGSQY